LYGLDEDRDDSSSNGMNKDEDDSSLYNFLGLSKSLRFIPTDSCSRSHSPSPTVGLPTIFFNFGEEAFFFDI